MAIYYNKETDVIFHSEAKGLVAPDGFVLIDSTQEQQILDSKMNNVRNAAEANFISNITPSQARSRRDNLLSSCDWTQLPKTRLTAEQVDAWDVYRQALRDITNQPNFPKDIVWPTPPK
jgi:hypothetical protein